MMIVIETYLNNDLVDAHGLYTDLKQRGIKDFITCSESDEMSIREILHSKIDKTDEHFRLKEKNKIFEENNQIEREDEEILNIQGENMKPSDLDNQNKDKIQYISITAMKPGERIIITEKITPDTEFRQRTVERTYGTETRKTVYYQVRVSQDGQQEVELSATNRQLLAISKAVKGNWTGAILQYGGTSGFGMEISYNFVLLGYDQSIQSGRVLPIKPYVKQSRGASAPRAQQVPPQNAQEAIIQSVLSDMKAFSRFWPDGITPTDKLMDLIKSKGSKTDSEALEIIQQLKAKGEIYPAGNGFKVVV